MASYGTLSLADTLAVDDADNIYVAEYGEDNLFTYANAVLNAHNAMFTDMVENLVEFTNKRISRYGTDYELEMVEADEFGIADAQFDALTGADIGWPLRAYQAALQWTRLFFEEKTLAEFTKQFDAITTGDIKRLEREIKRAFFRPTNYTFIDKRVDYISLPVKGLVNADGAPIQRDRFGTAFDGATHTHFLATASLVDANVQSMVDTVIEHGTSGNMVIYINRASEASVRGMASFDPYPAELIRPGGGSTADVAIGGTERYFEMDDRPIGVWDGAIVVWTKPWIPAGYLLCINFDGDGGKALRFRTKRGAGKGDLRLVANDEVYPLRANLMQREYGIGVWNRTAAAVLYTGGGSYTQPTL